MKGNFAPTLNGLVNAGIEKAYPLAAGATSSNIIKTPPGDLTSSQFNSWRYGIFKTLVGNDLFSKHTNIESSIEKYIGNNPAISDGGTTLGFPRADCMSIICNGKKLCIGSDKIAHMFKLGHMFYEIQAADPAGRPGLGKEYAEAFGRWTEGLPLNGDAVGARDWLIREKFKFFNGKSFSVIALNEFDQKWGGHVAIPNPLGKKGSDLTNPISLAQRSMPDVRANLGGMEFYEDLHRGKYANGAFNPSGAGKRFDICDYVNSGWEE